jgi:putative ABC transport system ATP-binding protein
MIRAVDLSKIYRLGSVEVPALRGVSFSIERGEIVAIMGASGSGKSTLMNILGCLDLPTSGTYELDGQDVASLGEDALAGIRNKKIGYIFQMFNLLPRMTVRRNVELPLFYGSWRNSNGGKDRKSSHQAAEEILESVGLADRMNHRPAELSGGQQQRVAIARALINEPELILADEPTGNLDSHTGAEILEILTGLNKTRGLTLILVTHDPLIAAYAGRVIQLKDGQVVLEAQQVKE